MPFVLPEWLIWVLPPLLGAIIGYVTNALAIRMLFRPLTRKYFLGIPLPLTPGIIPRQRESLAHSIARMVSRSLFNADVINSHIRGEKFQDALKSQLGELIAPGQRGSGSEDDDGEGDVRVPDTGPADFIRARIGRIEELVLPVLKSPVTRGILRSLLRRSAGDIGRRRFGDFLPLKAKNRDELKIFLDRQIEGRTLRRIKWTVVNWLKRLVRENEPMEQFFSAATLRRTIHILDRFYVPGVNFLLDFLRRPEIRKELVKRGKGILSDILMRLSPVQRIMLSAGQYDRTLEENMPGIVRDLLRTLENTLRAAENREKILGALHEFLRNLQGQGLGELQDAYALDLPRSAARLFDGFRDLVIREDLTGRLADFVARKASGASELDIDGLLESYAGLSVGEILERGYLLFIEWVDDEARRDHLLNAVTDIIVSARESARSSGSGERGQSVALTAEIEPSGTADPDDAGGEGQLISALSEGVTMLIEGAVPVLVERFDIYGMVVDRINGLDIEDVEQLLLGIIARHLKYINIFGAFLGALIGGAQLLLRLVG
jgi:hypothetical protein